MSTFALVTALQVAAAFQLVAPLATPAPASFAPPHAASTSVTPRRALGLLVLVALVVLAPSLAR